MNDGGRACGAAGREGGDAAPALEALLTSPGLVPQLPIPESTAPILTVAVASLALGGAERIVLDWAARTRARYPVRLLVLRQSQTEWPIPPGVEVRRLRGRNLPDALEAEGRDAVAGGWPVVPCHLLRAPERAALARGGARPLPVLHNARAGWLEPAGALAGCTSVLVVSEAAARDLRTDGWAGHAGLVRHIPRAPAPDAGAREHWRSRWGIPHGAVLLGMVGGVKPQKAYPRALRVLAALLPRVDAHLVIVGGPAGRDGPLAWDATEAQARRLGLWSRVHMAGPVPEAARCLPAFDLLLNTSHYEGLSLATLEALAAGLPVVASRVGGQGELPAPGLRLLDFDAPDHRWAEVVEQALRRPPPRPAWAGFASHRVWTLHHLAHGLTPGRGVLFVTANLNAGGAQRSLVNLACALHESLPLAVAVCGESSTTAFQARLAAAGVACWRSAAGRNPFDHAEALLRHLARQPPALICFWNLDPKLKLLLTKALTPSRLRLVDVSPGGYAFAEMASTALFQACIGWSAAEHHDRLDRLVLKYRATLPPEVRARSQIIPNGVPSPARSRAWPVDGPIRVVVSGRVAPSKFVLEIVAAMRLVWRHRPEAELHVLGRAEDRHADYGRAVAEAVAGELGRRVFLHGAAFDAPERLADHHIALVLGVHQGCPNAVLEAMAAGLAVVANDSGGTAELVRHGRTGWLLPAHAPPVVTSALLHLMARPELMRRLGERGRQAARTRHTMARMVRAYLSLFRSLQSGDRPC